jgi:hypothetical protein
MPNVVRIPVAAGAFDPSDITITDNTSGAFLIQDDSGSPTEYMRIDTTSGSELTKFVVHDDGANINKFVVSTDRSGSDLIQVASRRPDVGNIEGVFFNGSSTTQVWVAGPNTFRIFNASYIHSMTSTQTANTYLGGTSSWKINAPGGDIAKFDYDSNMTFTLDDGSGAVFKVVDDASPSNTYLKAVEAGSVSTERNFEIYNSTAPAASVTDGCILFCEDVSSSSELKVRDEAGNVTTLSPHNFSLIPEGASEEMAWSYYSEKNGKKINVDMLRLARLVEQISGEQIIFEEG